MSRCEVSEGQRKKGNLAETLFKAQVHTAVF
jgi:hypothetical protein